jgi:hypothetical protein
MKEKELSKFITHHAMRLNKKVLIPEDECFDFIADVVNNFMELQYIDKRKSELYCICRHPQPNYPEMVWCDKCGKTIKVSRCHICGGENGHHTSDCTSSSRPLI